MLVFEKIKRALLYDGLTKDDFYSIIPYIIKENNRRLKIYNIVAFIFTFVLFVISLIFTRFSVKSFVYLGASLCNLIIIFLLHSNLQKNIVFSTIANYFFTSLMMFFSIYIGLIKHSHLPAATFFAALALVPYILYNRVIDGFIHRLIFLLIFIFISTRTKAPEYIQTDLVNGITIFILSTIAGVRVQKLQVNGWFVNNNLDRELRKMSGVFETIRIINLATNSSVDYATDGKYENRIIDSNNNASAQMDSYIEDFVSDNCKVSMRKFCDISTLEDRMFNKNILISDYATSNTTWSRATFVTIESNSDGFPTKVVFTIQRIADSYYLNMLDFDLKKFK